MKNRCAQVVVFAAFFLGLVSCGNEDKQRHRKDLGAMFASIEDWKENSAAISASVIKTEMRNPYDYTLHLRVDSVLAVEGEDNLLLQRGDSIAVLPNFTYIGPGILDMRWKANQSLTALARTLAGQRLVVLVALARNGRWMLEEGNRE